MTSTTVRYYNFHTVCEGEVRPYAILGDSIRDAVNTLRSALYDGETIVGWDVNPPARSGKVHGPAF